MNNTSKLLIVLLVLATIITGAIYFTQTDQAIETSSMETYTSSEYSFEYPKEYKILDQADQIYITNSEAEAPLGLLAGEIWISISPTTEEAYNTRVAAKDSPEFATDGDSVMELVESGNNFYSVELIVGGSEEVSNEGQEVFDSIITSIQGN